MMEQITAEAYRASRQQLSVFSSYLMTALAQIDVDPDGSQAWTQTHGKPSWLVAIDYITLSFLLLVMAVSAITLASTALKTWRGGVIQLEATNKTEDTLVTRKEALNETILRNMDHSLHDDGEAVDSARFWRTVRRHKACIMICVVGQGAFQCYRLAISPGVASVDTFSLLQLSLEVAISLYAVLLLPIYACVQTDLTHCQITRHLFSLSSFSVLHFYFATQGQVLVLDHSLSPHWTGYYALGIACILTIAFGSISLGPTRYRDQARLYNKAVAEKIGEIGQPGQANVLGSGRYIIGHFMGFHVTRMVQYVASLDQVDLHELPVLPAALQQQPSIIESVTWGRKQTASWLGPTLSLLWEVWAPQWRGWANTILCLTVEMVVSFVPLYCIQQILYTLDGHADSRAAWAYAILWTASHLVEIVCMVLRTWDCTFFAVDRRLRAHLSFLLYSKLLTRSTYSISHATDDQKEAHSNAEVLNLIQSDMHKLKDLLWTFTKVVRISLQMGIGFFYIWSLLGPSGLWGLLTSLLIYPPAYVLSRWQYRVFRAFVAVGDKRVSLLQEAIQTISMIKMTASEAFWYGRLDEVRQAAFRLQLRSRLLSTASGLLYAFAPVLVLAVSFGHYTIIRQEPLTASVAFTAIAVFNEFRHSITSVPQLITDALQEIVSVQRISAFLQRPDVDYLAELESATNVAQESEPLVVIGDITWARPQEDGTGSSDPFILRDLDITFRRGAITLIAGKFGAGKSLLLNAILGEVALLRGRISYAVSTVVDPWEAETSAAWEHCSEGLAFVPQTAWLQSLSIRDNILFGLPMNVERYRRVLYACALLPDLEVLEDGDLTEIGERGKILSGGQKARVSLARAVYSRASTIILDDVISAVDAHTSQHIINKCFQSPLMAGRTIIIASHAVEALATLADQAIYLDEGRVQWQGTGPQLLNSEYMAHLKSAASITVDDPTSTSEPDLTHMPRKASLPSHIEETSFEVVRVPAKTPRQLLVDEDRAKGSVDFRLWTDLLRLNGGPGYFTAFILTTVVSIIAPVGERQFLKSWTSTDDQTSPLSWVVGYACLSAMMVVIQNIQYFLSFYGGFTAMKKIYQITQDKVLRAKMQFFSKTRAGSILQRLGPDLAQVPECSQLMGSIIESTLGFIISVVSVAFYVGWAFPLGIAILVALSYKQAMYYRSSSRQVRRLMSILPGPVNALYGETVAGAAVIRAFGMQSVFVQNLIRTTNMHQSSYVLALSIGRWMILRVNFMNVIIVSTTLVLAITTPGMTGSQAGFILGFATKVVEELHNVIYDLRNYDLDGVKLERLDEYRNLETEDIPVLGDCKEAVDPRHEGVVATLANWPSSGALRVVDLGARYAPDMPDILHSVSFSCEGGERVGIVGATGGGKSTLAKALFRFVEVTAGTMEIDGKNLVEIPLGILRSRIGIIAQDPVLLSGTLRLNLDIEGKYSDEDLFEALRQVQLIKANEGLNEPPSETSSVTAVGTDGGESGKSPSQGESSNVNVFLNLDHEIETGGQNLSAGQKQLVVMARALLERHKLLILDEATASIDSATDAEISRVVHERFEGVTVLIIAHRLRTIMPCSKILVMDQGRIVQQGSPAELINEEGGKFQSLCKAAGDDEFRHLLSITEHADDV